jgi:hypothetical protein
VLPRAQRGADTQATEFAVNRMIRINQNDCHEMKGQEHRPWPSSRHNNGPYC